MEQKKKGLSTTKLGDDGGAMVPIELVHTIFHFAVTQVEQVARQLVNGPKSPDDVAAVDGAIAVIAQEMGIALTREQFVRLTGGTVIALMRNAMPGLDRLHACIGQAKALMEASHAQAKAMGDLATQGHLIISADPERGVFMVRLDNSAPRGAKADASGNIVI